MNTNDMTRKLNGMTSFDTIVIGAGFAGLTAARELSRTDQDVVILEARDRLGGRTWVQPFAGGRRELGGAFVHWFQPHVWREISRYGLSLIEVPRETRAGWITQGTLHDAPVDELWAKLGELWPRFAHDARVVLERPYDLSYTAQQLAALDELTVQDRIDELGLCADDADILNSVLQVTCSGRCSETGLLATLRWNALAGFDPVLMYDAIGRYKLAEGTSALVEAIANDVKGEIRLGAVVERITQDDGRVVVFLRDGTRLHGRTVIVTAPLNTLRQIALDPPLTPLAQRLVDDGHAGRGLKFWMHVANEVDGGFTQAPDTYPVSFLQTEMRHPDGGTIVVGFGPDGTRLDVNDLEAVRAAVAQLRPDLEVLATLGHNWRTDEFSQGTWSMLRPRQATQLVPELRRAHGRVVFAGSDLAQGWNGFIDGAIESGLQAARFAAGEIDGDGRRRDGSGLSVGHASAGV